MDEIRVDKWNTSHSLTSALTSTLTTESPINRAFQAESEGVRVKKKNFFYKNKARTWVSPGFVVFWRVQRFGTPSGYDYIRCVESIYKVD